MKPIHKGWAVTDGARFDRGFHGLAVEDKKPYPIYGYKCRAVRVVVITEADYRRLLAAQREGKV